MEKKGTKNSSNPQTLSEKEFNEKIQQLEKMFGMVSVTTPSESVIRTAEIKAQSGIPDPNPVCEQSRERKASLAYRVKTAGNVAIGLNILNDAYNEAIQRLAEISEVMCDCYSEIELTPHEIKRMASEKFLTFVGTDYRLARASFIRSTSDAYGAVAINGRIEGPRFRTGSDKFASIRSEWKDEDGKPYFKEMSKEKEVSTKTRRSSDGVKKERVVSLERHINKCVDMLEFFDKRGVLYEGEKDELLSRIFSLGTKEELKEMYETIMDRLVDR